MTEPTKTPLPFGDPTRYYAGKNASQGDAENLFDFARVDQEVRKALQTRYQAFHESVERTVKSWNQQLRDSIRQETGLRLSGGTDRKGITVHVVDGLPQPLTAIFGEISNPLIWEIILNNAVLKTTVNGLEVLIQNYEALSYEGLIISDYTASAVTQEEIVEVQEVAKNVVEWIDSQAVSERLKQIDEDILGAYFFRERTIRIYWMAIGLISRMLNVSLEGLTMVVLAHELVHAYTHLGNDIDGEHWDTEAFAKADLRIVEGLAQFYTSIMCNRLDGRAPGLWNAFERLLTVQSPTYKVFKSWTQSNERAGEILRFSMIGSRKTKLVAYEAFLTEMGNVRERVGRASRANNAE
jgi:hypothetical protein